MRNLIRRFDRYYIGQIYGEDYAKNCFLSEYMNFVFLFKASQIEYTLGFFFSLPGQIYFCETSDEKADTIESIRLKFLHDVGV